MVETIPNKKIFESVQPSLKWLDAEKCLIISECIKEAESAENAKNSQKVGAYRNKVWKLFQERMGLLPTNSLAYFEFDEQIVNLYRTGEFYSDSEFNKISTQAHPGYTNFETNLASRHPGYYMKRGNGLLAATKSKQAVSFKAYLNNTLLAKEGTSSLA